MSTPLQLWYIRVDGQDFDAKSVYETYPNLYTMKIHHGGRFTNPPGKKYVDGEVAFVDSIDIDQCKIDILDTIMYQSLDYEEKMFYHYKIPLKGLDIGLRLLASDTEINEMLKYVHKHKIIYAYAEHDKSVVDPALNVDETGPSKILGLQNNEGEDEAVDEGNYDQVENEDGGQEEDGGDDEDKDIEDIVDEVEVQMNGFKFKVEGEYAEPMQTKLNITETDLKVLDFDSFESDVDDVKEIEGNTKEIAKGKKVNVHDKGKDKMVTKEEEDKPECPWVLYISKGDKGTQAGGNIVGSQGTSAARTQACTVSPMRRTKKSAARLTPTK
ncbi:hypothetical protein Tco_0405319 [Tanacetum coccineum]